MADLFAMAASAVTSAGGAIRWDAGVLTTTKTSPPKQRKQSCTLFCLVLFILEDFPSLVVEERSLLFVLLNTDGIRALLAGAKGTRATW